MSYAICYGKDSSVERRQTATECLELVKRLQARSEPHIKIFAKDGGEITIGDLERRHKRDVENANVALMTEKAIERGGIPPPKDASRTEPTRRDLLYLSTAATGVVGLGAAMIPLIDQMNPDASVVAAGGPIDLDLGTVEPGNQIVVRWRDRPVFVVFRTSEMLQALQDSQLLSQLADPASRQLQQPPYAANWHRSLTPEIAVLVGVCTHLGCIPQFNPLPSPTEPAPHWRGGYFCSCHGSMYDLAGRVFQDVPAPYNLPVPPYRFISETIIRIGENPPNVSFDFSSIEQI